MAINRTIAQTILVDRLGPLMGVAEMDLHVTGTNTALSDPLAWGTRGVGGTTAVHSTVTDTELAALSPANYDDLMMLAEYRTLLNILGALDAVDTTTGPRSEKLSQFVTQVKEMVDRLHTQVDKITGPLVVGYLTLDFAEHSETHTS